MSFIKLRNGRIVGDYLSPYIVAELNTSHFGDIKIAKSMIDEAKLAGCDCVKFQSWSADTLYSKSYYNENKIAKRVVTKFSLADSELLELARYSASREIDFSSTPYSIDEARFLVDQCDVGFVKIASMDLNNLPFLTQLGVLGVPLILSTGMGSMVEIINAVTAIEKTGNKNIIILHCTSLYPTIPKIVRLRNISSLKSQFPHYPVGYSDHSIGIEISGAAVALGACLIEKHFTLDSSRIGMDNKMAAEPHEIKSMVTACHKVHDALGGLERLLCEEEVGQIGKMRRSIVARIDIREGDCLTGEMVEFLRPGTGIAPCDLEKVVGRIAIRHVERGSLLDLSDFI